MNQRKALKRLSRGNIYNKGFKLLEILISRHPKRCRSAIHHQEQTSAISTTMGNVETCQMLILRLRNATSV